MSVKKGVLIGFGVLFILGVMARMGSNFKEEEKNEKNPTTSTVAKKKEENKATDAGDLGKYHVVIKDLTRANDYKGEDVAVVEYEFTNNSDKNAIFLTSISTNAFQNGVALKTAIMGEEGYVDSITEIQPNTTLTLKVPYKLNDQSTPVIVEASKLFSDKNKLTKEFQLQ